MKIKLLPLTVCMFFSLALLTTVKVNAQIRAYENFEYPVGASYIGLTGSGSGWAGPWYKGLGIIDSLFSDIIEGNLEGEIGATGALGGLWVSGYRNLSDPFINTPNNVVWMGFTHKSNTIYTRASGLGLFNGNAEVLYLGRVPGDYIGIGNCYQDADCLGPMADAHGSVLCTDAPHYSIAKITAMGGDIIKVDFWTDYDGLNEPLASYDLEPTYQTGGYKKFVSGIDRIRISGDTEPSEATTLYSTFDAIRLSSNFFWRYDYNLLYKAPLQLSSLTANSTNSGNLISWSIDNTNVNSQGTIKENNLKISSIATSSNLVARPNVTSSNIDYIEVLRKNEQGNYVTISSKLPSTTTTFTDTNPLLKTNNYRLRSTDLNGVPLISEQKISIINNLPLDLTSLTAKSTASGNLVSWISASSKNVKSLSVLRKDASGAFVSIADNLSATQTSFTDTNPFDGTNYYKLRSTDNDGESKTYDLIATAVGFDAQASFYPNPVTNDELNIIAGKESLKSVAIFDLSGKKVAFKTVVGKSTKISTQGIAKGIYILEVSGSKTTSRNKLVIE